MQPQSFHFSSPKVFYRVPVRFFLKLAMTLTWLEVSKGPQGCQCESQSVLQSPLESPSGLQPHLGPLPCESQPTSALASCPDTLGLLGFCYRTFISFPPLNIRYLQTLDRLIFISVSRLSSTTFLLGEAFSLLTPTSTAGCSGVQSPLCESAVPSLLHICIFSTPPARL